MLLITHQAGSGPGIGQACTPRLSKPLLMQLRGTLGVQGGEGGRRAGNLRGGSGVPDATCPSVLLGSDGQETGL